MDLWTQRHRLAPRAVPARNATSAARPEMANHRVDLSLVGVVGYPAVSPGDALTTTAPVGHQPKDIPAGSSVRNQSEAETVATPPWPM